jgi:hypothetical protein
MGKRSSLFCLAERMKKNKKFYDFGTNSVVDNIFS